MLWSSLEALVRHPGFPLRVFSQMVPGTPLCDLKYDLGVCCIKDLTPLRINHNYSRQYFEMLYVSEKIRLDISCESSARQMIHMKCPVLFSMKNNKKNFGMLSATNLLSALRVNCCPNNDNSCLLDHK